ncbi:MAG: SDR family NAD(P)-dependent oxidoreductase [Acidobacteria bacterium]|nr:SDR family NAD(P)-dependent oxidoreductase [Acidobacteriota bacterium]
MSGNGDDFHHIAIVGRFGRFPGAPDLDAFWQNLRDGIESVSFFSDEELLAAGTSPETLASPHFVRAKSVMADADRFDAALFGYSPTEAAMMDPQHRVFLEAAWAALEDAGYDPARADGRIGLFAGVAANTYLANLFSAPETMADLSSLQVIVGNDKDFLATKVSYKLDLRGPSVVVQTACSTSLVALHLACQSLINQETGMALAGGASVKVPLIGGYPYLEGGHRSPDGHCRAFDAQANGTAFGDGVGVVVLKRLADAVADGDTIHAVIRGTAINNDGALKAGYTAPSETGQAEVLAEALAVAGVEPDQVGMIEAHGTGTTLGDPIEVAALKRAYATSTREPRCALGSVKTNVGHLDAAAGVAGLLKTVFALEHGEIPPSLHFERPNPRLELEDSHFFVPTELTRWPVEGRRRAGVSSFGVGGTNAHVVLEEPPDPLPSGPSRPWQLLVVSARTEEALGELSDRLASRLEAEPSLPLADVAFTLQMGRRPLPRRRAVVARDRLEMVRQLRDGAGFTTTAPRDDRGVAFLFPGQGSQHLGMGVELYRTEPEYRRHVDRCCQLLEPHLGLDLRRLLDPEDAQRETAAARLLTTAVAQPALFVVSYSLARLWMSWGVEPRAMLGHSLGEWVAACLAGVISLEEALPLVAYRGALMQSRPEGEMLAVPLAAAELEPRLGQALSLAAVNGAERSVVSGPAGAVAELAARLEAEGVACRRLATSHAFHSAMMEPILGAFAERLREVTLRPPTIPFVSNVTGTWITPQQATDPEYWCRQLRRTVLFATGLETLRDGDPLLLEVGPGRTLASLARRAGATSVASLGEASEVPEERRLLAALGALWAQGATIDWPAFYHREQRRRVPLPTYPFERQRFWIERRPGALAPAAEPGTAPAGLHRLPPEQWVSVPTWHQLPPVAAEARLQDPAEVAESSPWLLLLDHQGWGSALAAEIRERGEALHLAREAPGPDAASHMADEEALSFGPDSADELRRVLSAGPFSRIVDLRPIDPAEPVVETPFLRLLDLALAAAETGSAERPVTLTVVTRGLADVAGEGRLEPAKALLSGVVAVLPQEEPALRCRSLDLSPVGPPTPGEVRALADELRAPGPRRVALRGRRRFALERSAWQPPGGTAAWLRDGGTYLITGGLGGLGWTLARHLAESRQCRLMLVGRSPFPPRDRWGDLEGSDDLDPRILDRIAEIRDLETGGAVIRVRSADVTDGEAMASIFEEVERELGPLDGVFHAAGVAGGGVARLRTREQIAAVLAPKVAGSRVLDALLAERPQAFAVFFSSVNAVLGGVGQVDYAAANAFLDTLAETRRGEGRAFLAIDWDAWLEVGMAAGGAALDPRRHPFLQRVEDDGRTLVAHAELRLGQTWVADEHRILGRAIVPGTGQLDVARALFELREGSSAVEIRDVFFMTPLVLTTAPRRIECRLETETGGGYRFELGSRMAGQEGGAPTIHGVARLEALSGSPRPFDLAAARRRCTTEPEEARLRTWRLGYDGSQDQEEIARYGPRWRCLAAFHSSGAADGDHESVAELVLDPSIRADLAVFGFHPGLMDVAVGSLYRARDRGPFAPFSYRRLRLFGHLPERLLVHARRRPDDADDPAGVETLSYDVVVCNADGEVLVEVDEYTYKRVHAEPMAAERPVNGPEPLRGLTPGEGVELLERLLGCDPPARAIVSTVDLEALEREIVARMERLRTSTETAPKAAHPRPDLSTPYRAPQGAAETLLAEIFEQVLGIDRVGVEDSFFELGGDSVIALQIIARAGKSGLRLSPNDLFQHPTVAALAARSGADDAAPAVSHLPPIGRSEGDVHPLSLNQERYWARYTHGGPSASLNLPVAVGLLGNLDLPVLATGLQRILDRHAAMRTRFRREGDGAVQVIAEHLPLRMPMIDLRRLDGDALAVEARRLRDHEAGHVFDLETEDLFRITLVQRSADHHELFVVKHHLITDGWSGGLFAQELALLYAALVEGREPDLPEVSVRYADYSVWQRRHLEAGGVLADQLDYWRRKLDHGSFPILRLSSDHPGKRRGGFPSFDHNRVLAAAPYEALKAFARKQQVTPFMVLLAAFNLVLSRYSGETDISITTDVANRDRVETEKLIGLFTNVLVLRNDLAGDPSVATLLERTRDSTVEAFDHQSLPFSRLMAELKPGRLLDYHEVFPVAFVFQNYPGRSFSLPGLELRSLEIDSGSVSRDLVVVTGETGDGLRISFRAAAALFEPETIERMVEDFLTLLERLPENTQRRVSELLEGLSPVPQLQTGGEGYR